MKISVTINFDTDNEDDYDLLLRLMKIMESANEEVCVQDETVWPPKRSVAKMLQLKKLCVVHGDGYGQI